MVIVPMIAMIVTQYKLMYKIKDCKLFQLMIGLVIQDIYKGKQSKWDLDEEIDDFDEHPISKQMDEMRLGSMMFARYCESNISFMLGICFGWTVSQFAVDIIFLGKGW